MHKTDKVNMQPAIPGVEYAYHNRNIYALLMYKSQLFANICTTMYFIDIIMTFLLHIIYSSHRKSLSTRSEG